MADQLFSRFPMLDAAIVNAVAESFASASGQIDVVEATRALETMLPNEYKSQSHVVQQLPDSICVVDPMHSFTGISPSNSSDGTLIMLYRSQISNELKV